MLLLPLMFAFCHAMAMMLACHYFAAICLPPSYAAALLRCYADADIFPICHAALRAIAEFYRQDATIALLRSLFTAGYAP